MKPFLSSPLLPTANNVCFGLELTSKLNFPAIFCIPSSHRDVRLWLATLMSYLPDQRQATRTVLSGADRLGTY